MEVLARELRMIGASLGKPNQIPNSKEGQQQHPYGTQRRHPNQWPQPDQQVGALARHQHSFFGVEVGLGEIKSRLGNPLRGDRDGANGHIQRSGRQSIKVGLRIGLRHQLVVEVVDPCDLAPDRQADAAELVA